MALTIGRCALFGFPVFGFSGGSSGAKRSHSASVSSWRRTVILNCTQPDHPLKTGPSSGGTGFTAGTNGTGTPCANTSSTTYGPLPSAQQASTLVYPEYCIVAATGTYQVVLPAGEVTVCVDNRELEPPARIVPALPPGLSPEFQKALASSKAGKAEPKAPAAPAEERASGRYVKIPERYYTVEQAQLKFTIQAGEQQHNIELKK